LEHENCQLEHLEMSGNPKGQLRTEVLPIVFALMRNRSLEYIDITGHAGSDNLALVLGKALQVNTTLKTLVWDDNHISAHGYSIIRHALHSKNSTLSSMPIPFNDVSAAFKDKHPDVIDEIGRLLARNSKTVAAVQESSSEEDEPEPVHVPEPVKEPVKKPPAKKKPMGFNYLINTMRGAKVYSDMSSPDA